MLKKSKTEAETMTLTQNIDCTIKHVKVALYFGSECVHMYTGTCRSVKYPWSCSYRWVALSCLTWVLESNSELPEEKYLLLTAEPSPWLIFFIFV